jgi:hypothetical protein
MRQMLATLCVALSLTLVALGGPDPTGGFHLGTLSFGRHLDNHGARLGYNFCMPCCRSWGDVQRVGEVFKLSLLHPYYVLRRPSRFTPLVVTLWGY